MRRVWVLLPLVGTLLHAQTFPGDSSAGAPPAWGRAMERFEIQNAELELRKADLTFQSTDFWHRLLPRITVTASFGIRGIAFLDASAPEAVLIPTDMYRLTLSLSLSDLIISTEHERARMMKDQAQIDLSVKKTKQLMDRHLTEARSARLRAELVLIEQELRLTERIHRYYALLFQQGKTSFDMVVRAELRTIEVRQKVMQVRAELTATSVN